MKRILLLFAHPRFEKSRISRALLAPLKGKSFITIRDLYELYPDFNIDIEAEKSLLMEHDIVIWHHPLYMYSAPPIIKQWIDMVLEFGWAHGPDGTRLRGKVSFNVVTSGASRQTFRKAGSGGFTLRELLIPFEQTSLLCNMTYLPPFTVQGTYRITAEELASAAADYSTLLEGLSAGAFSPEELSGCDYLNDLIASQRGEERT
ncbi:MAG: NAD(P)H-dependent oxidoreductase [Spirochaetes bacterium]|nr:NAD(P)H-dependent oxidoreductase [Spirochaetota bacterium]